MYPFRTIYCFVLWFPEAPAEFLKPLTDQKVKEFESATFTCEVSKSGLEVKWFRKGEKLEITKTIDIVSRDKRHTLTIRDCQLSDQSDYTIVVEEGVESTAKLIVEGKQSVQQLMGVIRMT